MACLSQVMYGQTVAPAFQDYPANTEMAKGQIYKTPDFEGRDAWAAMMKSRLTIAALKGPNFAGHYRIVLIGCGSGCDLGYVIDVANGEVFEFPFGGEAQSRMTLDYKLDSRLVISTYGGYDGCREKAAVFDGRMFAEVSNRDFDGAYQCE